MHGLARLRADGNVKSSRSIELIFGRAPLQFQNRLHPNAQRVQFLDAEGADQGRRSQSRLSHRVSRRA